MASNLQLKHANLMTEFKNKIKLSVVSKKCASMSKTLKDHQRIEINLSNKWKLKTICHGYSDIQSRPQTKISQKK